MSEIKIKSNAKILRTVETYILKIGEKTKEIDESEKRTNILFLKRKRNARQSSTY